MEKFVKVKFAYASSGVNFYTLAYANGKNKGLHVDGAAYYKKDLYEEAEREAERLNNLILEAVGIATGGKKWVVTHIDFHDSCDKKPRFDGEFATEDAAKAFVKKTMEDYERSFSGECHCDFENLNAYDNNRENGCEWNIEEVNP